MGERLPNSMARERDNLGRIKESYPLGDVYDTLVEVSPATTREVEEELGSAYATAYEKLRELEDDGRATSRKVANARLWSAVETNNEQANEDQ